MLKVEGLNASYGVVQVLHDVGFTIEEGECVTLLGSNGAGKTTMLKTISGLIKATSGNILFLGERIVGLAPSNIVKAGIIQVPEGGRIFPYLSVTENLLMGASSGRESWGDRKDSLKRIIKLFPILKERGSLQARLLSGGERQMLAIGRGLMSRPKLLMIDEPSLGLAPKLLSEIYDALKLLRSQKVTILLSEQNIQKALSLSDRGYVLENGRITIEGSSEELLTNEHVKEAYLGI